MRKQYKVIIIAGVFISIFCMVLLPYKKAIAYSAYPFLRLQQKIVMTVKQYHAHRNSIAELTTTVDNLNQEREQLFRQVAQLRASIDYLDELEELIDFKQRYDDGRGILAQILLKNFSHQEHFFLVDAGARAGVCVDMPVVYNNYLVGKVQEVYPLHSKVVAVTDRTCKVAAYCSQTGAHGIYHGMNMQGGMLDYVSHLSTIETHDLLFSSGEGLIFPRGFAIGRIKRYECNDLLYTIWVEPFISLDAIPYVLILPRKIE